MAVDVDHGAVDNLVKQFSSALDCLRELVQNSIDAQSPRVEVWMEYERGEGHRGTISIHVDDVGEGMDENIIDNQLTRLFASSKEGDLTKIGKFGIGFVSIFAIEPKGVLLHTGRGGEYWEVFFHEDRTFTKAPLPHPIEGTQITLFLEGDLHRYRDLVARAREALLKWCSHSETEVTFEDRSADPIRIEAINEPFDLAGDFLQRATHQGTEILVAYSRSPAYGFYNRGLTLALTSVADQVLDGRAARYGHIALKLKSRYLEHTLSRETVMRDENYEKAMQLLDAAVDGPLLDRLLAELERFAWLPAWGPADLDGFSRCAAYLMREPSSSFERARSRAILRTLDGRALSPVVLAEALDRDGRILFADFESELTDRLLEQGVPVMLGRTEGDGHPHDLLRQLAVRSVSEHRGRTFKTAAREVFGWMFSRDTDVWSETTKAVAAPEQVYFPVTIDAGPPLGAARLLDSALELLVAAKTGYKKLGTCQLAAPVKDPPLFVVGRELGPLMARPPAKITEREHKKRPEAAVNRDHPHFTHLFRLHEQEPVLASYCLAKSLLLDQDRLLDRDLALVGAALPEIRHGIDR